MHIIVTQTPISTLSQDLAALSARSLKTQTKKAQTQAGTAEALAFKEFELELNPIGVRTSTQRFRSNQKDALKQQVTKARF